MPQELDQMAPALLEALDYVGTGVSVIADRGNGIERLYVNASAAALLGYTREELDARPVIEMVAPEQRALVQQLSAGFRAGQPVPSALEITLVRKDGTPLPTELALGSFAIDGGMGYVLVLRDVTVHEKTHLSLLEADRIGLVGALAAGFAHQINNPLTSVLLNLRTLRNRLSTGLPAAAQPAAMRCVDDISTAADQIANNVKAFQSLASRGQSEEVDLAAVVSALLGLAMPTLEPRALVVRQIFPVQPVIGEESRIGQAVLAMLLFSSSGFDAEPAGGTNRITVSVEQRGPDIVLEVSDNGRDLSAEDTQQAFDPFYRSTARGAGVGVGLGVARSVAATLGGEVTLAARTGGGAVITMQLPAAPR